MTDFNHIIKQYSELVDDFLISIILLKVKDKSNCSLPFLYSHILEVSAKTACYKLGIYDNIRGHNIREILRLLEEKLPAIKNYIPSDEDFKEYKKFWRPISEDDKAVFMPAPIDIDRRELAYFIDNCMNLKYGFTLELNQVSAVQLCNEYVNPEFVKLLKVCRDVYGTQKLNERLKSKLGKTITEDNEIISPAYKYLTMKANL